MLDKVILRDKLAVFDSHWDPKVVGELNGQQVKLVKFAGEFVWHRHANEDELFLVLHGAFDLQLRDGVVRLEEGEMVIVPRGVEHCPRASSEVHVLVFEPATTRNTGDTSDPRTVLEPEHI